MFLPDCLQTTEQLSEANLVLRLHFSHPVMS